MKKETNKKRNKKNNKYHHNRKNKKWKWNKDEDGSNKLKYILIDN